MFFLFPSQKWSVFYTSSFIPSEILLPFEFFDGPFLYLPNSPLRSSCLFLFFPLLNYFICSYHFNNSLYWKWMNLHFIFRALFPYFSKSLFRYSTILYLIQRKINTPVLWSLASFLSWSIWSNDQFTLLHHHLNIFIVDYVSWCFKGLSLHLNP